MTTNLACQELSEEQIEMFLGESCKAIRRQYQKNHRLFCEFIEDTYNRLSSFLNLEYIGNIKQLDEKIISATDDRTISHLISLQLQTLEIASIIDGKLIKKLSFEQEKALSSGFKMRLPKILERIGSEANQSLAKKRFHPENKNAKPSFKELFWSYRADWNGKEFAIMFLFNHPL